MSATALRTFEEHLAETKAMREARREEDRMRFTTEDLIEDIGTRSGRVGAKPPADDIWLSGPTRFMKVYTHQAREFAGIEEMPTEMRIWFAALDRADYVGHAVFEPGELEAILGRDDRAIRRGIVKGKAFGMLEDYSNSRHLWLVGVEDGSGYGQKLAKSRFIQGEGYPAPATAHQAA